MKKLFTVMVWCVLLCVSASAWAQVTFRQLQSPIQTWSNYALSKDGKVMAANFGGEIFRWTSGGGFHDLGLGDTFNSSIGISADGETIVTGRTGRGWEHESGNVAKEYRLGRSWTPGRRLRP